MSPSPPTYLEVLEKPSLLVRNPKPSDPIHSFEGRVGNIIQDVVATSPNTDVLYTPPLNLCQTRMRRAFHFGPDNPLLHPQPFNPSILHLTVIRLKSHPTNTVAEKQYLWMELGPDLFVESGGLGFGLGRLEKSLVAGLRSLCGDLIVASADFGSDPFIAD
ncbi:hypothetical protein MPER_06592 [Moniliophthora perniciosa FA553]|nr:hypothetical protein MPER_06592 [Moniliophthora perniciosa FA553]